MLSKCVQKPVWGRLTRTSRRSSSRGGRIKPPFVGVVTRNRSRRWILECGPWASNPPLSEFKDLITGAGAGHSLDDISLADTTNIWMDPVELIEMAP